MSKEGGDQKVSLARLCGYYGNYKKLFAADMALVVINSAAALVIPLVVRYVTSELIYQGSEDIVSGIIKVAIALLGLIAIETYSKYLITYWGHYMGLSIESDMRKEIFSKMQGLSFSFYDDAKVGKLMSRITNDLFDISELMHHGPENILLAFLKITGALIILLGINPWLSLAAFILVPFLIWFSISLNDKMRKAYRKNREKISEINARIEDNLSGIRVVKSFANEQMEENKFDVGNQGFKDAKKNSYHFMGVFHSGIGAFSTLVQACVIVVGALLIAGDKLEISDLITFVLYIDVFVTPIRTIADFTEQFQNGYTGFERFCEIVDIVPDIEDAPDATNLTDVTGKIDFRDVSFRYSTKDKEVLHKINLSIPAGSYTALVGPSGAGKTTLCSLIPRFYDINSGSILIDGTDIRTVTQKSLRSHIGIVQQDIYLFAGTIADNIAYGKPGATRSEIEDAARFANAHDFIMSLPDGYDTDVGQHGIKLSGGQKQRISIARVFLKNPPILIFDEATSALDNESERAVQDSLEVLAHGRTTLVIAHRLTTIQNAERILVMTEDGITESGTHEELLAAGGTYASYYQMYL